MIVLERMFLFSFLFLVAGSLASISHWFSHSLGSGCFVHNLAGRPVEPKRNVWNGTDFLHRYVIGQKIHFRSQTGPHVFFCVLRCWDVFKRFPFAKHMTSLSIFVPRSVQRLQASKFSTTVGNLFPKVWNVHRSSKRWALSPWCILLRFGESAEIWRMMMHIMWIRIYIYKWI